MVYATSVTLPVRVWSAKKNQEVATPLQARGSVASLILRYLLLLDTQINF